MNLRNVFRVQSLVLVPLLLLIVIANFNWNHFKLSLLALNVLRERQVFIDDVQRFSNHATILSTSCIWAMSFKGTIDYLHSNNESLYRLTRFILLSCEGDETIINHFNEGMRAGRVPDAFDVIYVSDIFVRTGSVEKALELRKASPQVSNWYVNMGRIEIEWKHDETKALDYFQLAEDINPGFAVNKSSLYMYLCLISIRDNKTVLITEPCADFDRVRRTPLSQLLLGRHYYSLKRFDRAVEHLTQSIVLDQTSGDAYFWLGRSLSATNNINAAESAYRNGIAHAPQYPWTYLELAKIESRKGCYESARAYLNRMKTLDLPDVVAVAEKEILMIEGQYGTAQPACK